MNTRFPLRGALTGAAVAAVLLAISAVPSGAQDQPPTGDPTVYTTGLDGSDPDTSTTPPPPDTLPPGLGDGTGDLGCWSDGDGSDCPTAETLRLLGCFEGAVQGNVTGCTIGGEDPAPVDTGPIECEWVRPSPGVHGHLVCPERTAGLVDLPDGACGYLSDLWCVNGGGGTPVEMLETELAGCYALETEIPLSEWISPGSGVAFRGGWGNTIPDTVNPRAMCIRDIAARLATLQSPQGWFNSETVPRTSAGFPLSVYHMYSEAGGLTELHRPFVGMVLSLVWQAGQVALKVSMWAFDWAVSGNVTEILTGIPAELAALLQDRVVHGLRLYEMGLTLLAAVVAWKIVRARLADAAGTLVFALLAFSLGWFLLTTTAFEGYYKGAQETRELLAEGLTLGAIEEAGPGGLDAAAAMTVVLDSTVHTPWEHLNFGQELNNGCAVEAAQAILVDGIRSQSAADLDLLRACPASTDPDYAGPPGSVFAGGDAVADFAANPSGERLFGTFIVVAGQIAVAVLVMAAAMLALLSEVLLAAAFASLPLAVAGVLWPGGRRVAGAWCSLLLRGLVGFGVGMLFLSLVMTVLAAVVGRTQGLALLERSLAFFLVAYGGVKLRKVFPKAAAQFSATLGGKVSAAFSQQGRRGLGPALGGTAGGLAGGLAASYLNPTRMAQRGAMMARRGASGVTRRVTGMAAAGLSAAALARKDSPDLADPSRSMTTFAGLAQRTKGGQLAARDGLGMSGVVGTAAASALGRKLATVGGAAPPAKPSAASPFAQALGGH